jgi:hypothetical protein
MDDNLLRRIGGVDQLDSQVVIFGEVTLGEDRSGKWFSYAPPFSPSSRIGYSGIAKHVTRSQEQLQAFGEKLQPKLAAAGIQPAGEPEIFEVLNVETF